MTIEFGLTSELTNTQYAPLGALLAHYQQNQVLAPLRQVAMTGRTVDFAPVDKLVQALVSILAGCSTLSEVQSRLKQEQGLARIGGWPRFADQSNLSRMLSMLTLMQIEQLQSACTQVWQSHSRAVAHDWRGYLLLDFDLSGMPCGKRAELSQKGYFSGKKT